MFGESDVPIHVLCGHYVFQSFVFHFTRPKKKQAINLRSLLIGFVIQFIYFYDQTSNTKLVCQISMRNALLH